MQQNLFSNSNTIAAPEVRKDHAEPDQKLQSASATDLRKAGYLILTIAAIFVINAMEAGSYRTPWPVAVVVSLAGFGVLAYSFLKSKREKPDT